MNLRMMLRLSLGVMVLMMTAVATAHHSFAGRFDGSRALHLEGVVASVEVTNPHSYIYLDVRTADGEFQRWALEGPSVLHLRRRGWEQVVKAGDTLGVCGYVSTDTSRRLSAAVLMLASGEKRLWENYRQGKCGLDH